LEEEQKGKVEKNGKAKERRGSRGAKKGEQKEIEQDETNTLGG